jgi:hypothetical protein
MSTRLGTDSGARDVGVCEILPSLGNLSVNDLAPTATAGTYSVEDIGGKRSREELFEMLFKQPGGNDELVFNNGALEEYWRVTNTETDFIYWYPRYPKHPGVFTFKGASNGADDLSDFRLVQRKGVESKDNTNVDGNGTFHQNPHYLRDEWTLGFSVEMLKPDLQKERLFNWWEGWDKNLEPAENKTVHKVEKRAACPETKEAMIQPFIDVLKKIHGEQQEKRTRGKSTSGPRPFTWEADKFDDVIKDWLQQPGNDGGDKLDGLVELIDDLGNYLPLPLPPGFIEYRNPLKFGSDKQKDAIKAKTLKVKIEEPIYIGPRWKWWKFGNKSTELKEAYPEAYTDKGYRFVREKKIKSCWLSYIDAQTSQSTNDPNKQAHAKVDSNDLRGQKKKANAVLKLEAKKNKKDLLRPGQPNTVAPDDKKASAEPDADAKAEASAPADDKEKMLQAAKKAFLDGEAAENFDEAANLSEDSE